MNRTENEPTQMPNFIATYSEAERGNVCEFLFAYANRLRDEGSTLSVHRDSIKTFRKAFRKAFRTPEDFQQILTWTGLEVNEDAGEITCTGDLGEMYDKITAFLEFVRHAQLPNTSNVTRTVVDSTGLLVEAVLSDEINMPTALQEKFNDLKEGEILTEGRITLQEGHASLKTIKYGLWTSDALFGAFRNNAYVEVIRKADGVSVKIRN